MNTKYQIQKGTGFIAIPLGIDYTSNCFTLSEMCESHWVVFEHYIAIP